MTNSTTYVFIDSQNLHLGIKNLGWDIDYKRLFVYLKEKYNFNGCILYIGFVEKNQKLYKYLQSCGFEIVFKNTKQIGKGRNQIKGNIDVDLTVDAIRRSTQYKVAVFISADGDFAALYDYLITEKGKEIFILIPNMYSYSKFLLKYRKNLRFMNDLKTKIGKQ